MSTHPDVFIIESLDPDDEGNGRFEGSVISHILRLHGKNPKYKYVRTRSAFEKAVRAFAQSNYRYLHISAHANKKAMYTTNDDAIEYADLAKILTPCLKDKRLFLSACSMVHRDMAKEVIPKTGCYSIVGPTRDIYFAEAAVFWPSIYHLVFTDRDDAIKRDTLNMHLQSVSSLFKIDIGYYSRSKNKRGFSESIKTKHS